MFHRESFQVHRPVNASEHPVIGIPFCPVDRRLCRHFTDGNLQQIGLPEAEFVRDVIPELVKCTLVDPPGQCPVDLDFRVGHGTFENKVHLPVFPGCRDLESIFIQSFLVRKSEFLPIGTVIPAVVILPESLLFPVGRHLNGGPKPAVPPGGAEKLPGFGGVVILSGEIQGIFLCLGTKSKYGVRY